TAIDQCASVSCTNDHDSHCLECEEPVVEHFNCYELGPGPAFASQTGISVVDQFGSSTATATKPKFFCAAASHNGSTVVDDDASLCCYDRTPLNLSRPAHVQTTD